MKKVFAILFVVALIAVLPLTAFAATGVNEHEREVLNMLETEKVLGANGWYFAIPQAYVNSAENFFAGEGDMTEEEKKVILSCIETGMAVIQKDGDAQKFTGKEYNLNRMSDENRAEILRLGQKACAEVDLNLVYVPSSNKVVITPMNSSTPVFESAPIVKVTGQAFAPNAGTVAIAVAVVVVLGSAVMFGVSKKKGLLV